MLRNTLALAVLLAAGAAVAAPKPPLGVGVDANYALDMEKAGTTWRWDGASPDLFAGMAQHEVRNFRVRLWTRGEGAHGRAYATEIVKRALAGGLDPYLVIFLSEDWADMMKQPVPAAWKDLTFEGRLDAVRTYSREIVAHFRAEGLRSHLYEIGNEIDYGICGEYPGKGTKKNPEALSRRLWPRSAELIRASQAGVLEADPEAQFILHIAHWWDAEFCVSFFRFMLDHGVQVDQAGLSYFPSSNIGGSLEMAEFGATATRLAAAIQRPVIVPETAYPSTRDFSGQFSRWKYEVPGYPLTPDGQRRWIADFLAYCHRHPDIHAVYYWSPEWCGEGMWKGFALFDPAGAAKSAWSSFAADAWQERVLREPVYIEVSSNQLFVVPVEEAKSRMVEKVTALRRGTGGVTVEHIALLSNTALRVGAYDVNLKASLQQNLSLTRAADAAGVFLTAGQPDYRSLLAGASPATHRVVVFLRGEPTPECDRAVARIEEYGYEVIRHPCPDGPPLRFGLCGAFADGGD
jgi:arabinogalactan endo-1,4-beta-galactosidase